ncbi:MAG: recR [Parcubacteria group bacterium]|nr:recR [Parcubacteria group bacterium]
MNSIDRLTEIFSHFPGIGPRQAKRFVYFLLSRNNNFSSDLIRAIENIKKEITQCADCKRFFAQNGHRGPLCSICSDTSRDREMLMLVPRDIDLEAVERSGSFKGYYFVLGGSIPILEKEPEKRIRLQDLESRITRDKNAIKEIILAMNANSEGENTAEFIKEKFRDTGLPFTTLGRGLSTGAELEYADPDTLKNAFLHRT